jgi:transposase
MIASARLHDLDPEDYLRDLFRVLPLWPSHRYLELAPKNWAATRARLDAAEIEAEVGWLTIPPAPQP